MKKILLGFILLSSMSFATDKYLEVKIGTDFNSKYSTTNSRTALTYARKTESNSAFTIGAEFMKEVDEKIDIGFGVAYQRHSKRETGRGIRIFSSVYYYSGLDYESVPVYIALKYKFNTETLFVPYVKVNLGYSFNFKEEDEKITRNGSTTTNNINFKAENGAYYALGVGVEYKNLTFEVLLSETKSNYSVTSAEGKADYRRIGATLGYKFNL